MPLSYVLCCFVAFYHFLWRTEDIHSKKVKCVAFYRRFDKSLVPNSFPTHDKLNLKSPAHLTAERYVSKDFFRLSCKPF